MSASITIESWIWYGAVTLMFLFRITARYLLFKDIRKFQFEDWFMLVVFVFYTILIVFLNICADVSTNLITPEDAANLTPQDVRDRVYGSKCVLVVESMMCAVQWGTKACLLLLYYRLTENLRQRYIVIFACGYCALTYLVMISLYYGYWCRPFSAFWQTPTPNIQCATQTHHLIVNLTFNLTSDLLTIFIPLPMFIKARLEWRKKLLLVFPFSLGFFTMVCAILSKHLSFTQPFSAEWIYWYTREASTAMIVANMPYSWAIIRKIFRLKSFLHPSSSDTHRPSNALEGQRPSGASLPDARGSTLKSWAGKTILKRQKQDKQDITTGSIGPIMRNENAFDMVDWNGHDENRKIDHSDSGCSFATKKSQQRDSRAGEIADVDRLYRLDDEDLERSVQQDFTTRTYEP